MAAQLSKDEPLKKLEATRGGELPLTAPSAASEPQLHQEEGKCRLKVLTGRKATPKEHVEEVLGGDVGLEAAVEVGVAVAVAGGAELLVPELVVLLPLLGAAQHGVRVPDGCGTHGATISPSSSSLPPAALHSASICLSHGAKPELWLGCPHVFATGTWHMARANPGRGKPHSGKNSLIHSNDKGLVHVPRETLQLCREIKF